MSLLPKPSTDVNNSVVNEIVVKIKAYYSTEKLFLVVSEKSANAGIFSYLVLIYYRVWYARTQTHDRARARVCVCVEGCRCIWLHRCVTSYVCLRVYVHIFMYAMHVRACAHVIWYDYICFGIYGFLFVYLYLHVYIFLYLLMWVYFVCARACEYECRCVSARVI